MAAPNIAMGWKGYCLLGDTNHFLPYTGFDLSERDNTIPAEDIHGGGMAKQEEKAFYSQVNAADGTLEYNGSISGNIYAGSGPFGSAFKKLITRTADGTKRLEGFETANPLIITPGGATVNGSAAFAYPGDDGIDEFRGGNGASKHRCVVSSLSLNAGTGGLSTWSANFISTTRKETSTVPEQADLEFEDDGTDLSPNNPVPWHAIEVTIDPDIGESDLEDRVTSLTINIDNQSVPLYTFNRARTVRDVYQSQLIVTGSFQYFADDAGVFSQLNKAFGAASQEAIRIKYGVGGGGEVDVTVPFVALGPGPIPSGGANEIIYRTVEFRGLSSGADKASFNINFDTSSF